MPLWVPVSEYRRHKRCLTLASYKSCSSSEFELAQERKLATHSTDAFDFVLYNPCIYEALFEVYVMRVVYKDKL